MVAKAIVLHPNSKKNLMQQDGLKNQNNSAESQMTEILSLAGSISLNITHSEIVAVNKIRSSTLFGKGVIDRLVPIIETTSATIIIVNCNLSPIQQRNLELAWKSKVIDRTGLILEIFGARARTHEGRLQVELAALSFQRSRLVRSWTHLERQRGGAGFLGGPGESQIELDRRQIDGKINQIKVALKRVTKTRLLHRKARTRKPFPIVAFVGYTNAGKSTLFNRLTGADVLADNMLFATLDPTMREISLPSGKKIILSDTVGFVSNLPTHLVAAFKATLEEVIEADIIVHVRDVSHPESNSQKYDVEQVLRHLGVNKHEATSRIIEVLNKSDKLDLEVHKQLKANSTTDEILLSAVTGEGCSDFCMLIDEYLNVDETVYNFQINSKDSGAIAWLYEYGNVKKKLFKIDCCNITVSLSVLNANRFSQRFGDLRIF
ncbi:MAG: GTPase HflX [Rhodospirillaceae bacterium]|nr:GTPase HflX [Rhodospirillaceae bacterium]